MLHTQNCEMSLDRIEIFKKFLWIGMITSNSSWKYIFKRYLKWRTQFVVHILCNTWTFVSRMIINLILILSTRIKLPNPLNLEIDKDNTKCCVGGTYRNVLMVWAICVTNVINENIENALTRSCCIQIFFFFYCIFYVE